MGTTFSDFGVYTVNSLNTQETIVFFVILGRTDLARDHVTSAQAKAADLRL